MDKNFNWLNNSTVAVALMVFVGASVVAGIAILASVSVSQPTAGLTLGSRLGEASLLGRSNDSALLLGRVTNRTGKGLTGATVELSGPQTLSANTQTSGNYLFKLEPGTYKLKIVINNQVAETRSVTLGKNATVIANFTLN